METFFSTPAYYCHPSPSASSIRSDDYFRETKESETAPLLRTDTGSAMYTDEEFAALACISTPYPDLEAQAWAMRRSKPLPPPPQAPEHLSRYQTMCWYLSNRPRDTFLAAGAIFIAFIATLALVFLVFILFMQSTGQMGNVMQTVDAGMAKAHKDVMDVMCVFAGPECGNETVAAVA